MPTTASGYQPEQREPRPLQLCGSRGKRRGARLPPRPKAGWRVPRPPWTLAERAVGGSRAASGGGGGLWRPPGCGGAAGRGSQSGTELRGCLRGFCPGSCLSGPTDFCCGCYSCAGYGAPGVEPQDPRLYHKHCPLTAWCPHQVPVTPIHSPHSPSKCTGHPAFYKPRFKLGAAFPSFP